MELHFAATSESTKISLEYHMFLKKHFPVVPKLHL